MPVWRRVVPGTRLREDRRALPDTAFAANATAMLQFGSMVIGTLVPLPLCDRLYTEGQKPEAVLH